MGRNWTQQQNNAINATNGSVLVSAAAGSGKTAVLVERVIRLITREENPVDVDRLLIVTFTRAAAAEMKQRISAALTLLLEKDPYNPSFLKQKQLLYSASISTIDSFCSDIVREYFYSLGISRDFRIADSGELDILCKQSLDATLEKFYSQDNAEFIALADAFSSKGGDVRLRATILKICEFLSTQPFPEKWLDDMLENYGELPIAQTIWGKIISEYALSSVEHAINLTKNSLKMLDEESKLRDAMTPLLSEDLAFLEHLKIKLLKGTWDEILNHVYGFVSGVLSSPRGYKEHPVKLAVATNRKEVKATISTVQSYFMWSEDEATAEIARLKTLVEVLFDVVKNHIKTFDELKRKKNVLSFADVESLTVKLLAQPDADGYKKTEQANEIANRFDYVMVDEFQDVNDVQDLIFKCVSNGENNLFAVGDVKQSIYGFRQAKPEIFIKKKADYNRFNAENPVYPATIILDKNFRSRKEVCNSVNFIFKRLMTAESAQMDYTNDEMLNVGATYNESKDCDFEIALIDNKAFENEEPAQIEALYIARKIHEMIGSGFLVKDGDIYRTATFGDFAVIIRSPKSIATQYVNTLINCGIPAYSEEKENAFDAQEVKIMLNLLRVIDNPTLDIPMLSVMCSPIYGFTPDELAQIRAKNRHTNLYTAVEDFAKSNAKAKSFLCELSKLRAYSYTVSVDDLLEKIYETTAFSAITCAVKSGKNPTKNLYLLREYARNFEANGYKTLSQFIYYIDSMIENSTKLPASTETGGDTLNKVRVLSIHSSKGLEYPICFIADAGHRFNKKDMQEDILIDSRAGLGIKRKEGICRFNTLPRLAVSIEMNQNFIAEELRVLYVALTRAKEKLIVVSSQNGVHKYLENLSLKITDGRYIEPYTVVRCSSISDWICLCALVHPSMNKLRISLSGATELFEYDEQTVDWKMEIIDSYKMIFGDIKKTDSTSDLKNTTANSSKNYLDILKKRMEFKYPNSEILDLPQKVSVSAVAHDSNGEYFEKLLLKPRFISTASSSVERGTAHHKFLQFCDFASARKDIDAEIKRLVLLSRLTQAQADCIDKQRLSSLLSSGLITKVINSPFVLREEKFIAKISPSKIFDEYADLKTDAKIIVQGAVDLVFEDNGELVLLDYKTDRVKDISQLKKLYSKQLLLYKEAMEQSLQREIKQCIICSVHHNDFLKV